MFYCEIVEDASTIKSPPSKCKGPLKMYIFYANRFLYVLEKKSKNKLCLEPHDAYCLLRMFFSLVNNKKIFFFGRWSPQVLWCVSSLHWRLFAKTYINELFYSFVCSALLLLLLYSFIFFHYIFTRLTLSRVPVEADTYHWFASLIILLFFF